jgi:BlaI family penicillinase repressor
VARPVPLQLGKRERQIVEALYRAGEASVAQVLKDLPDPPSYSGVRAMLNLLVGKKVLAVRQLGKRYLYRPAAPKEAVRGIALRNVVNTFFGDAPADAMAALIDGSAGKLTADDLRRVRELIERAERDTPAQPDSTSAKGKR